MDTNQKQRADRAQLHFHFCMASLTIGDWETANAYLKAVESSEGRPMYQSVVDMIALATKIPPIEPGR